MTTEEKRKAIDAECNNYEDCESCPHDKFNFCKEYNHENAEPEVIDEWYTAFFGDSTPHIKDSGERREFTTGAVRDIQEGKGRCDLMPLDVVAEYLSNGIMLDIYQYQQTGDIGWLRNVLGNLSTADPYTITLEVAKHFEEGAKKYGEYNWQKGIPTHCYIDSAVRHYLKWLRGDNDEPHDRAFVWNILCCIWTCIHKPELNDYGKKECTDCKHFTWCEHACGGSPCDQYERGDLNA